MTEDGAADGAGTPPAAPARATAGEGAGPTSPQGPNLTALALSVVVPAHNEEAILEATVETLVAAVRARPGGAEVLVVENGSHDLTAQLADALAARHEAVRALHLPRADYGAALAAGLAAAGGDYVACFDADYYDLDFLDEALRLLGSGAAGIVVASKRAPGARDERPLLRRALTAAFSLILRASLALPVRDAHGMKVLDRVAVAPFLPRVAMRGSLFDVELVVRASRGGLRVAELPARVREQRPPRTPVWRRSLESGLGLLRLALLLRREQRP